MSAKRNGSTFPGVRPAGRPGRTPCAGGLGGSGFRGGELEHDYGWPGAGAEHDAV